jgi:cytochrome P450
MKCCWLRLLTAAVVDRMVVTSDPDVVRDVLVKRPKGFRRTDSIEYPSIVLGFDKGVFVAEGEDWGRTRRLTAPAFSHANLAALVGTISVRERQLADDVRGLVFEACLTNVLFEQDCGVHWLQKIKELAAADGTITSGTCQSLLLLAELCS